jgi:hypothetical protein
VRDGGEEISQVDVDDPLIARVQLAPDRLECILGGSPGPIPEVGVIEVRLEDRFQPVEDRLLTYPIVNRREADTPPVSPPWGSGAAAPVGAHRCRP